MNAPMHTHRRKNNMHGYLKMHKCVKISQSDYFMITILFLNASCLESKNYSPYDKINETFLLFQKL